MAKLKSNDRAERAAAQQNRARNNKNKKHEDIKIIKKFMKTNKRIIIVRYDWGGTLERCSHQGQWWAFKKKYGWKKKKRGQDQNGRYINSSLAGRLACMPHARTRIHMQILGPKSQTSPSPYPLPLCLHVLAERLKITTAACEWTIAQEGCNKSASATGKWRRKQHISVAPVFVIKITRHVVFIR